MGLLRTKPVKVQKISFLGDFAQTACSDKLQEAPHSLPLEPGHDIHKAKSIINAPHPSLRNPQAANTVCSKCWPLGASELGYCICADLALCNVMPLVPRQSPASSLEQFPNANSHVSASSGSQRTYDTDMPSLPRPQEANACLRCWPLGASELGYCICGDLAIAGILPPAL